MRFFTIVGIFAIFALWASAFPSAPVQPALTQALQRSDVDHKPSNVSIPGVTKPYEPGESSEDHPDPDPELEEHIAWYNAHYPHNQIPRRIMSSRRQGSLIGEHPVVFHQYEIWNTLRIGGSLWRAYQDIHDENDDPRPIHSGIHYPRPVHRGRGQLRRVAIGELNWDVDTVYEFPILDGGRVFGEDAFPNRAEYFVHFSFRDSTLDHPVYVGMTSRSGHTGVVRHWCPEVHVDGTMTNQQTINGFALSGIDMAFRYIVPLLFLRSWNPAVPWDKHHAHPNRSEMLAGGHGGLCTEGICDLQKLGPRGEFDLAEPSFI